MLSFGIRFGQGFDKSTILKMIQLVQNDFDYDLIVIGTSPGGVACAREAKSAGKKVVLIRMGRYSPAEEEGFDEDLNKMAEALEVGNNFSGSKDTLAENSSQITVKTLPISSKESSAVSSASRSTTSSKTGSKKLNYMSNSSAKMRKVRLSRLDLNNEFFKRGQQCRKLMHNATILGDLANSAQKSGWRIANVTTPLTINWKKMTEEVMDFVMKENWTLQTILKDEDLDVIDGFPTFIDEYRIKISKADGSEEKYSAAAICLAISSECIIPPEVIGAMEHGITCDDFIRMDREPGKTLIVGSTPEGLECAGILACCRFPVTVVSRSDILKNYDSEMTELIVNDLKDKGVKFMTDTTLTSVRKTSNDKLIASFIISESPGDSSARSDVTKDEYFDTILFAVGRKVNFADLNVGKVGIETEPNSEKILAGKDGTTTVPHIYAVGDIAAGLPEDFEFSELDGKLLGKRLFHNEAELLDHSVIPSVMYTPTEYAFVGISEDAASFRLGEQCVDIYYGNFTPLDFVIPARKGCCFAKIIVFKRNDLIIGMHIFAPEAGEMIQGFAAAIKNDLTMTDFRKLVGLSGTKVHEILKLKEVKPHKVEEELFVW